MGASKYSMSFTAGALLYRETIRVVDVYLQLNDWDATREKVKCENLLQARTLSSLQRLCSEIISRLKTLQVGELQFLNTASPQDQAYLLWVAICRRYTFIGEFAAQILRERYFGSHLGLQLEDFDVFFNHQVTFHPELDKITIATRKKLRQVLFKMLVEIGLIDKNFTLQTSIMSAELRQLLQNSGEMIYFPCR